MKKTTKTVNSMRSQKALYNAIMESVTPQIARLVKEAEEADDEDKASDDVKDAEKNESNDVDEAALNELFGFGSSVKKPEKTLSLENSDDENADLFIAWCAYYMSKCSNDVKKVWMHFVKLLVMLLRKRL